MESPARAGVLQAIINTKCTRKCCANGMKNCLIVVLDEDSIDWTIFYSSNGSVRKPNSINA